MIVLNMFEHTLVVNCIVILCQGWLLICNLHLILKHILGGILVAMMRFTPCSIVLLALKIWSTMNVSIVLLLSLIILCTRCICRNLTRFMSNNMMLKLSLLTKVAAPIWSISTRTSLSLTSMLCTVIRLLLLLLTSLIMACRSRWLQCCWLFGTKKMPWSRRYYFLSRLVRLWYNHHFIDSSLTIIFLGLTRLVLSWWRNTVIVINIFLANIVHHLLIEHISCGSGLTTSCHDWDASTLNVLLNSVC